MSRDYQIDLTVPQVGERVIDKDGQLSYTWRVFFEDIANALYDDGVDLVKNTADTVDGLALDYYTRAQADAKFATITTTYTQTQVNNLLSSKADTSHTHTAADTTSGTFADARIPELAISKVTGLQGNLDAKVASTDITDLGQTIGATPSQAEVQAISNKVDEILAVLRA